jgi:hypothetical protein
MFYCINQKKHTEKICSVFHAMAGDRIKEE